MCNTELFMPSFGLKIGTGVSPMLFPEAPWPYGTCAPPREVQTCASVPDSRLKRFVQSRVMALRHRTFVEQSSQVKQ